MLQTGVFFFRYNRVLTERRGSITATQLLEAGAAKVAADTGIMAPVIEDSQNAIQKKAGYCHIPIYRSGKTAPNA